MEEPHVTGIIQTASSSVRFTCAVRFVISIGVKGCDETRISGSKLAALCSAHQFVVQLECSWRSVNDFQLELQMHALRVRWSAYKSSRRLRKAWDELAPNTQPSAAYDACCGLINGTDMWNRELRGFIEALNAATDDVLTTADATELHQSLQSPDEFVEMCLAAAIRWALDVGRAKYRLSDHRNDRYGQIVCQSLTTLSKVHTI